MAPLTLSQLLDVAIGTSGDGAVDLPSLHRLLQSMLGHLGLRDLPVLEPGHRPTALLGGHQATKDQPGLEKEEDRAQGPGQQPREPEEHLPGKELLQGTASGSQVTSLANDVGQMKIAANKSSISKQSMAHILADIQTQVSSLHGWMSSLQGMDYELQHVKQEVRQLEEAFGKLGLAGADGKAGSSHQIPLQLGSTQQEMIKATLETLVTKRTNQLQEQLDELRAIVESAGQELAGGILDTRVQLAQLVQHVVTSQQDGQLLNHIQASVAQVQGDCDKLRIVLKGLLDHRGQEQKSIEKADKTSLAGKVSQSQFEASVEQLKEKMEELTSRVTGQEQGWHQVQRQLKEEMESKLDRLELGPFRQQLEEQWNSLQEQLEEKVSQAAAGEAAGIKKQLLAHFQSLSCDQPLSMLVPGPALGAGLPLPSPPQSDMDNQRGMHSGSSKQDTAVPWEALATTLNSGYHVQVMEIPWHLRHLDCFYVTQKHRVDQLTKNKLDRAEFEKQHQLLLERGQQNMARTLADLQSQVSSLQGWVSSLQGMDCELEDVKQEVRQLEEAFGKLELAGADGKAGSSHQIPLQLG
ncbi:hypothetical protein Q9233_006023 [Columba guinea]|nr:hypothetical protein Q9233_006023 [Columba guinea]